MPKGKVAHGRIHLRAKLRRDKDNRSRERPGSSAIVFASALLLGALIDDRLWRLVIFANHDSRWLGMIPLLLGLTLAATGRKAMVQRGTNLNPTVPTTAIVENGPFRFTRNPSVYVSHA